MSDQSPSELERDAERVRAQIADTAGLLQDKMSPGQLMEEVVKYFKDGDTSQLLGNLKTQVRDNPLALALVGSGLAWLMMGSGSGGSSALPNRNPLAGDGHAGRPMAGSNTYGGTPANASSTHSSSASLGDKTAALGDSASDMAASVSDMAGSAAAFANRTMHDLRDGAAESWNQTAQSGSAAVERARSTLFDALDREPLVLGALGVAVGAAIGAMLPTTAAEKEYLGDASSKVRESAEDLLGDGLEKAKHVGANAYRAARDEADRQGFVPHGKPLAQKLSDVAKAAGTEIKAAAVETLDQAEAGADKATDAWSSADRRS